MAAVPGQLGMTQLGAASAPPFRLGTWAGSMRSLLDYARQDTKTEGSQQTSVERRRTEQQITLRNSGAYIYDPRLVTLTVGGTFGLSQEGVKTDGTSDSREGRLWGFDAFAGILPGRPVSLNLLANRDQSFVSRELAGQTEVLSENLGATLFVSRSYIPSTLAFRRESREDESRAGAIVTRREEERNIITYEGRRGWIDSEMDLRYEFLDLSDKVFPDLSFQSHEGELNYSLDFGPELNRRWDSRLHVFTRTGVTELTNWNLNELLRIDHTERLRSDFRYSFVRTETSAGVTTTHAGESTLQHRLYESLTTTLGVDGTVQTLPGGEKDTYRGRLDLAYTKRLPREGRLNVGLGGEFQYEDDRFGVAETSVSQETHTAATPFALPIALRNPFVVPSSVVVTKVAVGPLPAGCLPAPGPPTPLVLGGDYTLRTDGDITEIVPLPCSATTPGINPGDTIAVDYRFTVSPSLTFTTTTWRADVSLDYRWIRPFFIHEQSEQELLSGRDGQFLNDMQSDTVGTELRYDGRRLRARLLGEARRFTSSRQAFDTVRSAQSLALALLPTLALNISGDQAFSEFSRPRTQSRTTLTGRAALTYSLGAQLFVDTSTAVRYLKDSLAPTERTTEAGLRVRWLFRKLEVNPALEFFDRQRGETNTKEYRATLRIIRRF
ncbi:MAG: hypothetical protein ACE5JS_14145 [Nitrospinota bacterium]